jgi:hypothetical protein
MNSQQLQVWIDEPETHQKLVGEYDGAYSVSVNDNPPSFLLRVEPQDTSAFPSAIEIHGQRVPVEVKGSFRKPVKLRSAQATTR